MMRVTNLNGFVVTMQRVTADQARFANAVSDVAGDMVWDNLTVGARYSPGTPVDTGEALFGWERKRVQNGQVFTNDVAHVLYLERDKISQQAPDGFIGLTVLHWQDIVRDAARLVARRRRGGA